MKLTTAQAIVKYLIAQRTIIDGTEVPLFPGVFAIFGHGNVTCLGHALEEERDALPVWRGQNEQGMALAAVGYAKAMRRRQIMVASSSIGPGATNMITAAGVAMANRLPVLIFAGETFQNRIPDPVLQQVEHFGDPTITVNDGFKSVTRYWDRITRPEQVVHSLPHAVATMLDPATCGPAFIALPQDVQAESYDYPESFFETQIREAPSVAPDEHTMNRRHRRHRLYCQRRAFTEMPVQRRRAMVQAGSSELATQPHDRVFHPTGRSTRRPSACRAPPRRISRPRC